MRTIERAAVMGSVAAGKSTFAQELATVLTAPLVSIDDIYKDRPASSYPVAPDLPVIHEAAKERWVIEGNGFSEHLGPSYRIARADVLFLFDVPPMRSLANHIARYRRINTGLEQPAGGYNGRLNLRWYIPYCLFRCPEGVDRARWVSEVEGTDIVEFKNADDASVWLGGYKLDASGAAS